MRTLLPLLSLLVLGTVVGSAELGGQSAVAPPPGQEDTARPHAPVPFGPGEVAVYQVKLGPANVGEARLALVGLDTVRGEPTYKIEMSLRASAFFGLYRVNNVFESWLDARSLVTRRFIKDQNEPFYNVRRVYEVYPDENRWHRTDNDEHGATITPFPLDELGFVYYVRTLRLGIGETLTLNRYFKEDGNPVVMQVVEKRQTRVPAGTFNTIVVKPVIRTSGLFREGGNAEIHFSDDELRHVVYMRSDIPVIPGAITLHLTEITRGTPITP